MKLNIFLFLVLSSYLGFSQSIKTETVSLSFNERDFGSPLPFDVPFKIKGTADKNVEKILFQYRIKARKKWHYFPPSDDVDNTTGYTKSIETWTRNTSADDKFSLSVGPLHPNVEYEFKFIILKKIELTEEDDKLLRADLLTMMSAVLVKEGIQKADIDALNDNLGARIQTAVSNGHLTDINLTPFVVNPFDPPLDKISTNLLGYPEKIKNAKHAITIKTKGLTDNYLYTAKFKEIFTNVITNKITLNPAIKPLIDKPISPLSTGYETYKLSDFFLFYNHGLINRSTIELVLTGKAKIAGATITTSNTYDLPSIEVILNFYKLISSRYFATDKNIMIFSERETDLKQMVQLVEEIITEINKIKEYTAEMEKLKTVFPNLLKDKVVKQSYNVTEESGIDITSEKNPYVGLDLGIVYAPGLSNVFTYQGANIYFVPVNKKAPISTFKGKDKFGKIFSVYIGITQKVGGPTDADYKPLFNDAGSLLAGFGFRFNRITRVNVGGLIYQYKNINPVLDKYDLKVNPTISLSVDLDVVKALGDVGKLIFSK